MSQKAEAVKFLTELKELLEKYNVDISCSVTEGFFELETIQFDMAGKSICEFYNPACVSAGEIQELLDGKPLGHKWLAKD